MQFGSLVDALAKRPIIIITGAIVFAVAGGILAFVLYLWLKERRLRKKATKVTGTFDHYEEIEITKDPETGVCQSHRQIFKIEYQGKEYFAKGFVENANLPNAELDSRKTLEFYINPDNPNDSVPIQEGVGKSIAAVVIFCLLFIVIFIIAVLPFLFFPA